MQGQQGGVLLYFEMPTGQGNGPFRWIQLLQDTEFAGIAGNIVEIEALPGIIIPAGIGIGGILTNVTLTSGLAIGYYA